jgi:hypothetical protein
VETATTVFEGREVHLEEPAVPLLTPLPRNLEPDTRSPTSGTRTRNPKVETQDPKPQTRNLNHYFRLNGCLAILEIKSHPRHTLAETQIFELYYNAGTDFTPITVLSHLQSGICYLSLIISISQSKIHP